MDTDQPLPPDSQAVLAADHVPDDAALEHLADVLEQLEANPDNVPLIRRQIALMRELGMTGEVQATVLKLASLIMLDEDLWLSHLDDLIQSSPRPLSLDSFLDIAEQFEQAEQDYLSLATLIRHVEFIILCARTSSPSLAATEGSAPAAASADVTELLQGDTARTMLAAVVQRGQPLLAESHLLWQPWLEWEMESLSGKQGPEREEHIAYLHDMFLSRMASPHTEFDFTSSAYSTFCSEYAPHEYESRLVQATEAAQLAKNELLGEKRYGKTRQDFEQEIAYGDLSTKGPTYLAYIKWEVDQRVKNPKQNPSPSNPVLIRGVFERAAAFFAHAAAITERTIAPRVDTKVRGKGKGKGKGKQRAEERADEEAGLAEEETIRSAVRAYKEAEAGVWARYTSWMEEAQESTAETHARAVRACPQVGATWARLLKAIELQNGPVEEMTTAFERALALGLLTEPGAPVSDLVDMVICRAAYEVRTEQSQGTDHPCLMTVTRGFEAVSTMSKTGDPSLRLEKFLLDWAETRAPEMLDQALLLVDTPTKARASSYQMVLLRAGIETRRGDLAHTRQLFEHAIQRSDLDWPEAVYEAYIQFENVHGDLGTLLQATSHIEKEQEKVTRRREKAAQQQMEQYQLAAAEPAAIEVEVAAPIEAATEPPADETDQQLKRDREHTTVLVTGIPKGTESSRIDGVFQDCGHIRETTVLSSDEYDTDAALVEFRRAESIPAALARDRRKIDGQEISVSMLWRSTLFITNIPRGTDDPELRKLLSPYGSILQTRWPSRKYAEHRRFCYVTMDSPASAQNALELHGSKTSDGFGLTVLISDPSAKARRSDAGATTLFVGGLTAKTTEQDVRELFAKHGAIRYIKLGLDPVKQVSKGFAFVDMSSEAEAQAALQLHGVHLNGRLLKVEISDRNRAKKPAESKSNHPPDAFAEKRGRTVRLLDLPEGTQEGLLQQALEKLVPVRRLEIFAKGRYAVVELASQADLGKLLLRPEPFIFNGAQITITEHGRRPPPPPNEPTPATATAAPQTALSFAPRAARKPKAIGKGRHAPAVDKALPPMFVASSAQDGTDKSQDDFRAMVAAKNKQREAKLTENREQAGEKRNAQDEEDHEVKRQRTE